MDCLSPHLVQAFPSAVVAISCGAAHSLALCATGEVLTWGCGLHGETALDMAVVYATTPQLVPLLSVLQEKESVTRVKAGGHRSVLVTSANRVLSWGESDHQRPEVLLSTLKPSECVTDLAVESDCLWVVSDTEPSTLAIVLHASGVETAQSLKHHSFEKARARSLEWWVWVLFFTRRTLQQRQLVRNWCDLLEQPSLVLRANHAVTALVEKGIPPILRQRVWPLLIGNTQRITPETYELCILGVPLRNRYRSRALSQQGFSESVEGSELGKEITVQLINEDLKRTFVPLGFFGVGEPLFAKIREVLLAYAFYRPVVGYVQGMSFLAGILAVHIPESYLCFQCLCNMLGSEHLYAFYSLKVGSAV